MREPCREGIDTLEISILPGEGGTDSSGNAHQSTQSPPHPRCHPGCMQSQAVVTGQEVTETAKGTHRWAVLYCSGGALSVVARYGPIR